MGDDVHCCDEDCVERLKGGRISDVLFCMFVFILVCFFIF